MVNFSKKLQDNIYVEWSDQYMKYKQLKKLLKKRRDEVDEETHLLPLSEFKITLENEMQKVEKCYLQRLSEFTQQNDLLKTQYRQNARQSEEDSLSAAFVELYRLLTQLQNFAILNYTGFVKILKKHDKQLESPTRKLGPSMRSRLQQYHFAEAIECQDVMADVEKFFAEKWCDHNVSVARTSLLVKKEDQVNWRHIYIGIRVGTCLLLLIWVAWDSVIAPTLLAERLKHTIPLIKTRAFLVYRGVGCLIILMWLWAASLYVWRSARINYRYIFELDARSTMTPGQVLSEATNLTIIYLVNVLLYYKTINGGFPEFIHRGYFPLALFLYALYRMVRPWKYRRGVLKTIVQVMMAPFTEVTFLHTFVGDYMTSTIKVDQDLLWSGCFFLSGEFYLKDVIDPIPTQNCANATWYTQMAVPLFCALPLWWRFQQNLRRIKDTGKWCPSGANAFKYALAQIVSLFGVFHPIYSTSTTIDTFQTWWILVFSLRSLYTWVWDVKMDWGLGDPKYGFLAKRFMYTRKSMYYTAIVADLFLRFLWMSTLIPPNSSKFFNASILPYIGPFTMIAELLRRTMWSFFRLENEHLRNTQGFRRVDFIPLHFDHGVGKADETQVDDRTSRMRIFLGVFGVAVLVIGLSFAAIAIEDDNKM